MLNKWLSLWPGVPVMPTYPAAWKEQVQWFRKRWAETVTELLKRQRETLEAQFKFGQQNIEKAFEIGEVKTPEELRAKAVELWQKCFESVLQLSEAQAREFQVAVEKWVELVTTPVPTN
jgi:predicted patatin/cPLA2 family phospholipase